MCRHSVILFFSENNFLPIIDNNNNFYNNISSDEGNIIIVNCDISVDSRIINNESELSINNRNPITNNIAIPILDLKESHALPNISVHLIVKVLNYIVDITKKNQ